MEGEKKDWVISLIVGVIGFVGMVILIKCNDYVYEPEYVFEGLCFEHDGKKVISYECK